MEFVSPSKSLFYQVSVDGSEKRARIDRRLGFLALNWGILAVFALCPCPSTLRMGIFDGSLDAYRVNERTSRSLRAAELNPGGKLDSGDLAWGRETDLDFREQLILDDICAFLQYCGLWIEVRGIASSGCWREGSSFFIVSRTRVHRSFVS